MDGSRFDAVVRSLGTDTRRSVLRSALRALAPTALVALLADPEATEAAKNGRCKPACATCQQCKKGKCKKTNNGKKTCKKGRCRPAPVGTPCEAFAITEGACCAPDAGALFDGCCFEEFVCCPNSSGGGCCPSLADCCSVDDDCENPLATCANGCCLEL